MTNFVINPFAGDASIEREHADSPIALGRWVLVADAERQRNQEGGAYEDVAVSWMGCITEIGSNYVFVAYPPEPGSRPGGKRIHIDTAWETLTFLSDAEAEARLQSHVAEHQASSGRLMGRINELSMRLGLKTAGSLTDQSATATDSGTAVAVLSGRQDVSTYAVALRTAKEETLPALFKELKEANKELARWLAARTLPMMAQAVDMKDYISQVDDRLFNIGLYAGLMESIEQVAGGSPAGIEEKLHVMQRRCYMDEECLVNYKAGGMRFSHIGEFDAWLAEPENRDRILPFPKCMVAFRVRRHSTEGEWDGTLMGAHISMQLGELDKQTFLYIRNGDQLWRLQTEIDFGNLIFPDKTAYDPAEPMMMKKRFASNYAVERLVTRREYDALVESDNRRKERVEAWKREHPGQNLFGCPDHDSFAGRDLADYSPFDRSSVNFDEGCQLVEKEIKEYNRIALIIQGVFDRSQALHPHLPVQTWTPEGFARAIHLVFDGSQVLHDGDAPDFEAYRDQCNASLTQGAVVIGQKAYWLAREREREQARRESDYRLDYNERHRPVSTYWRPQGNPGPKEPAVVTEWKPRSRMATFTWEREKQRSPFGETIACRMAIPASELFNISAYRPGDYKRFYQDSRTRAMYMKWAPMLLAAEDWWARHGAGMAASASEDEHPEKQTAKPRAVKF